MEGSIQYIIPILSGFARYFIFAGIPFLIFYVLFPDVFKKNKIQARFAKRKDFIREILHSMQTTLILVGIVLLILKSPLKEYTLFYSNISDYPLWWIPVSILLSLVLHDTYFYWMHRTLHRPKLYKKGAFIASQINQSISLGFPFFSFYRKYYRSNDCPPNFISYSNEYIFTDNVWNFSFYNKCLRSSWI